MQNLFSQICKTSFPATFAAAQVRLTPVDRPRRGEGFIRRAADPAPIPPVRPSPDDSGDGAQEQAATSEEHPASNDDGAGKRLSPRQGTLRLVWPEPDKPADNDRPLQGIERADQLVEPPATKGEITPAIPQRDGGTADEAEGMPVGGSGPARGNVPGSSKDPGEGQEPDQPGPSAGKPSGAGRRAAVPDQAKPEAPLAPTDPRRLALEDGEPKPGHDTRETRNVGEFDIDI